MKEASLHNQDQKENRKISGERISQNVRLWSFKKDTGEFPEPAPAPTTHIARRRWLPANQEKRPQMKPTLLLP